MNLKFVGKNSSFNSGGNIAVFTSDSSTLASTILPTHQTSIYCNSFLDTIIFSRVHYCNKLIADAESMTTNIQTKLRVSQGNLCLI